MVNWKAIVFGLAAFIVSYGAYTVFVASYMGNIEDELPHWFDAAFYVIGWIVFIIPGYAAMRIAKAKWLMTGAVTGAFVAVIYVIGLLSMFGMSKDIVEYSQESAEIFLLSVLLSVFGAGVSRVLSHNSAQRK